MKKAMQSALFLALALLLLLTLCACGKNISGDPWTTALYKEDTTLGSGSVTFFLEVKADGRSVTFTVSTDETVLGDALLTSNLIAGDEGDYGLYIKSVNGIPADYDVDGYYWAIYENGEYLMTGVDGTEIIPGGHYELVREK